MPKNDLDLEYLPIDPATVQPGEPVASSGGILSYVENPEGFFLMLKKQISALQYRADISYDVADVIWDGNIVNPRLLTSRTNLNVSNALPVHPDLSNANWLVTDLNVGLSVHRIISHGGMQVIAGGIVVSNGGVNIAGGLELNNSFITDVSTINASGLITSGAGLFANGPIVAATTGTFSGAVTAAAGGTDTHLTRRDTYATNLLGGTLKARLAGADLFLTNNGVNP